MVMLSGGATQTQPLDGGGLLQSILNAAGGVTNTIANLTTPQQQQQASNIAAAIVQQPQRQPIVVAPNQPMPQIQASPVLLAQNQTMEDQGAYGDMQSDVPPKTPFQMLRDNGYQPMSEPQYDMPAGNPAGQPQQPDMETGNRIVDPYGNMVPLDNYQPGPAPVQYDTNIPLMQQRQAQAMKRALALQGLANMQPPPQPGTVSPMGYGQPQNWRQGLGNIISRLHGAVDPRGYGAQNAANYRAQMDYQQAMHAEAMKAWEQREKIRQEYINQLGSDAVFQSEANINNQMLKQQEDDFVKNYTDPKNIMGRQEFILKATQPGTIDRANMIQQAADESRGLWRWHHLLGMDSLITDEKAASIRGKEARAARSEQDWDYHDKADPARIRSGNAKATIAESQAKFAQEQQETKTEYAKIQNEIAAINKRVAAGTADAKIASALGADKQKLQGQAFKALEGMSRNYQQEISQWERMNNRRGFISNPDELKAVDAQIEGMFGPKVGYMSKDEIDKAIAAGKLSFADAQQRAEFEKEQPGKRQRFTAIVDNVLQDYSTEEKLKLTPQLKAMAANLPEKIFEAQAFKQYGYGRMQNNILSGKGKEAPAPAPQSVAPQPAVQKLRGRGWGRHWNVAAPPPPMMQQAPMGNFASIFKGGPLQGGVNTGVVPPPMSSLKAMAPRMDNSGQPIHLQGGVNEITAQAQPKPRQFTILKREPGEPPRAIPTGPTAARQIPVPEVISPAPFGRWRMQDGTLLDEFGMVIEEQGRSKEAQRFGWASPAPEPVLQSREAQRFGWSTPMPEPRLRSREAQRFGWATE